MTPRNARRIGHLPIDDLKQDVSRAGDRSSGTARANVELSFYRGYQTGYEQAMEDAAAGCLDKGAAMQPSRSFRAIAEDRK